MREEVIVRTLVGGPLRAHRPCRPSFPLMITGFGERCRLKPSDCSCVAAVDVEGGGVLDALAVHVRSHEVFLDFPGPCNRISTSANRLDSTKYVRVKCLGSVQVTESSGDSTCQKGRHSGSSRADYRDGVANRNPESKNTEMGFS